VVMSLGDTPINFIDFEGNRTSGILEFGVVTIQRGGHGGARTRCAVGGSTGNECSGIREPVRGRSETSEAVDSGAGE